jgi:hypothetical protein
MAQVPFTCGDDALPPTQTVLRDIPNDCSVVSDLYESLRGQVWAEKWQNTPLCYSGTAIPNPVLRCFATASNEAEVTGFSFVGLNLTGTLPPSIGSLLFVQQAIASTSSVPYTFAYFQNNNIHGSVPPSALNFKNL